MERIQKRDPYQYPAVDLVGFSVLVGLEDDMRRRKKNLHDGVWRPVDVGSISCTEHECWWCGARFLVQMEPKLSGKQACPRCSVGEWKAKP